jgi:pyruvate/oxaloacetate carboxyltransferase
MNEGWKDLLLDLQQKTGELIKALEEFEYDIDCSPFDIQDAQSYFEEVTEKYNEVQELLNALATDDEDEDDEDE